MELDDPPSYNEVVEKHEELDVFPPSYDTVIATNCTCEQSGECTTCKNLEKYSEENLNEKVSELSLSEGDVSIEIPIEKQETQTKMKDDLSLAETSKVKKENLSKDKNPDNKKSITKLDTFRTVIFQLPINYELMNFFELWLLKKK